MMASAVTLTIDVDRIVREAIGRVLVVVGTELLGQRSRGAESETGAEAEDEQDGAALAEQVEPLYNGAHLGVLGRVQADPVEHPGQYVRGDGVVDAVVPDDVLSHESSPSVVADNPTVGDGQPGPAPFPGPGSPIQRLHDQIQEVMPLVNRLATDEPNGDPS